MASRKRSISNEADICAPHKEWDEASCPICMEHPHNAVLLLCTSHEKGCRSYICDTSYRHSNCLDRFKKLNPDNSCSTSHPSIAGNMGSRTTTNFTEAHANNNLAGSNNLASIGLAGGSVETAVEDGDIHSEAILPTADPVTSRGRAVVEENNAENLVESKLTLTCPLCRGTVLGWKVVEEVRHYLDLKPRCCSRESCSFSGNYRELRRHARRVHPSVRPADIDPSRERAWRHLEHQREYADIVSAIRSAMPGAVVLGDYVVDGGDRIPDERERASGDRPWWTTFFLFQMIGSMNRAAEPRSRSRIWAGHRRSSGGFPRRRFLWGENLLGLQDDDNEDDEDSFANISSDSGDDGSPIQRRRRRRRLTRSTSDEDHL